MLGSLSRGGGEIVLGIPGACATRNSTYLVRGPLANTLEKGPTEGDGLIIPYPRIICFTGAL